MANSPVINKIINEFFLNDPDTLSLIHDMRPSLKVALAYLLDGKVITTSGNNVEADHYLTRASSLVDALENAYGFPIEHKDVTTSSDLTGKSTIQTVYYIKPEVIGELKRDAKAVFAKQESIILVRREARTQKLTRSLVLKVGGTSNALMRVFQHHFKGDDEKLKIIKAQVDEILNDKSYR